MELPTYAWQRERFWIERPSLPGDGAGARAHTGGHPLLGEMQSLSTQKNVHLWEAPLDLSGLRWLQDHQIQQTVIFPGAGYLEMALSCGAKVFGTGPFELSEVAFVDALALAGDPDLVVQAVATEERPGLVQLQISSREQDSGRTQFRPHCRATLQRLESFAHLDRLDLWTLRAQLNRKKDAAECYAALTTLGLQYGAAFQGLCELWHGEGQALGHVRLPAAAGSHAGYRFHPALLDACLQVMAGGLDDAHQSDPWVPVRVGSLRLFRSPPEELFCHMRLLPPDPANAKQRSADALIVDAAGNAIAELKGLVTQQLASRAPRPAQEDRYLGLDWESISVPPPKLTSGRWLLLGDGQVFGRGLRAALEGAGHRVVQAEIHHKSAADLTTLLQRAFGEESPTGIVHVGSLSHAGCPSSDRLQAELVQLCNGVLTTVQAIVGQAYRDPPRLWLLTRGAQPVGGSPIAVLHAAVLGFGRTIAMEHPELRCARLDLDPACPEREVGDVLAEVLADDTEDEIALHGRMRRVQRLVRLQLPSPAEEQREPARGRPLRLQIDSPGKLDDLKLRLLTQRTPGPAEVEIAVESAGLNFIDVMKAMGVYPGSDGQSPTLGTECAGRVVAVGEQVEGLQVGQEVVAIASAAFATHVTVPSQWVVRRPAGISAGQAAVLPSVYMTAWYGLVHLGRLCAGERVLIHSATGGTGLAAVHIARHLGAQVFATAGTEEKRAWLREQGIAHVMDSRSLEFAEQVMVATGGEGVDVVLNSLAGDAIEASLSALAADGRFIELGKSDIYSERSLQLSHFKKGLLYSAVDLAGLGARRPEKLAALLREVMALLAAGTLPLLPVESFPISRADEAFRKMAQARHIGKLALNLADPDAVVHVPGTGLLTVRSDGSYLITGGLGALGLSVAGWLAAKGAGHLVLLGRRGAATPEQQAAVAALEAQGARVTVAKADVSSREELMPVLQELHASDRPLRGIVHAAGVLDDALVMQQSAARLWTVMAPKAQGAWNLHEATLHLPLDFFVMYSSSAGLLGSPGQGNYAAASAFLDALACHRKQHGLPALSIDWGPFAEAGLAANEELRGQRLGERGVRSLSLREGLDSLERLLQRGETQVGVVALNLRQWGAFYQVVAKSARLERLRSESHTDGAAAGDAGLLARLAAADPEARIALLAERCWAQVARVLRLPESNAELERPLTDLGMDSLMGLELRNRLESLLGIKMAVTLLWTYPTVAALARKLGEQLFPAVQPAPAAPATAAISASDPSLSEDEGDLFAELDETLLRAAKKVLP